MAITIGGSAAGFVALGALAAAGYFAYRAWKNVREGRRNTEILNTQRDFAASRGLDIDEHATLDAIKSARKLAKGRKPSVPEAVQSYHDHVDAELAEAGVELGKRAIEVEPEVEGKDLSIRYRYADTGARIAWSTWNPTHQSPAQEPEHP